MRIHSVHKLIEHRLSISTKAFKSRGCNVVRCRYCQIEDKYCICAHQPDVENNVSAIILMSPSEVLKPSNTGRLIADVIKDTHTFQWHRTEPDEALLNLLTSNCYAPVIIFPQEYVSERSRVTNDLPSVCPEGKRWLFIFIDSNWREAKKIFRKSPYLDNFPVLSISPTNVSQYLMRKSDNQNHLSTAEVAAMVLRHANEKLAADKLQGWFEVFRESYLLSKTRMKIDLTRPSLTKYINT